MVCEGCGEEGATRRVNFPGSPIVAKTFNIGPECRVRIWDMPGVLDLPLDSTTETPNVSSGQARPDWGVLNG